MKKALQFLNLVWIISIIYNVYFIITAYPSLYILPSVALILVAIYFIINNYCDIKEL